MSGLSTGLSSHTFTSDAEELLSKNCESAEKSLKQIAFDLDYLRDQMTITEVTMARLYNWDVKRRKEKKASA